MLVPVMGTSRNDISLGQVLFGPTRRMILALIFGRGQRPLYLRQLIRAVGTGQGAVQRELGHLEQAGIINAVRDGRRTYYYPNRDCRLYTELRALVRKLPRGADG